MRFVRDPPSGLLPCACLYPYACLFACFDIPWCAVIIAFTNGIHLWYNLIVIVADHWLSSGILFAVNNIRPSATQGLHTSRQLYIHVALQKGKVWERWKAQCKHERHGQENVRRGERWIKKECAGRTHVRSGDGKHCFETRLQVVEWTWGSAWADRWAELRDIGLIGCGATYQRGRLLMYSEDRRNVRHKRLFISNGGARDW